MEQFRRIHIDGIPFLFRENPGLVFTQITGVHRLPLMPGCMAGVSLVDGSPVSFADLAAFLEMRTHTEAPRRNAVIFSSAKNRLGFLWHGKQEKIQIEEDRVYQLPEFLQTGLIDSCVSFNDSLIPVIEPNTLRTLIKEAGPLEQEQRLIISGKNKSTAAFKRIYLFGHHKERYAVDASLVTEVSAVPRHVRKLPHLPPYVKGIFLYKEHPIPLMDIGELLKLPKTRKPKACMIIAMNGNTIGLLTESQPAQKTTDSSGLYSLPPLVSAGFLHTIIENQKKLVPCIDIFAMFREENTDEKTYSYTVSGEFSGRFLKRECEVIEFSLFGVKHAVPKTEVEDIIPYSPVRGLPLKLPILIGVKRRNDEIVPVIDIARCFNIFSFTDKNWKMICIKNGDFKALVLTEKVYGAASLPKAVQRELPLTLPYPLVYGCYTTQDRVILILNIWAMAVNFHKEQVHDFYKALFREFFAAYAAEHPQQTSGKQPESAVSAKEKAKGRASPDKEAAGGQATVMTAPVDDRAHAQTGGMVPPDEKPLKESYSETQPAGAHLAGKQSADKRPQEMQTRDADAEPGGPTADDHRGAAGTGGPPPHESGKAVPADAREKAPPGGVERPARHTSAGKGRTPGPITTFRRKKLPTATTAQTAVSGQAASGGQAENNKPAAAAGQAGHGRSAKPVKKRVISAAAVFSLLLLAGAGLFLILKGNPFARPGRGPAAQVQAAPAGANGSTASGEPAAKTDSSIADTTKTVSPVEPAGTGNNTLNYKIQWGDTLAHIARRFTGNPYDYKRIAGENKIKDPDFILAGDEIKIIIRK